MGEPPDLRQTTVSGPADRLSRSEALVADLSDTVFATTRFDPADPGLAEVVSAESHVILHTDVLPIPMQREISWWMATCHATGERIVDTSDWKRWTATAADVVQRRRQVCSFADLDFAEWMTAWARVFHADHGRMAAPATRQRAENALREVLARLIIHYSELPWWKHDLWCPRFDPRIPRREHEPRGQSSTRWDNITPVWLREGFKFYLHLKLESGQLTWSSVAPWHVYAARLGEFATSRGLDHPALVDDPADLRALVLEFRTFLQQWRRQTTGRAKYNSRSLDTRSVANTQRVIGNFYREMNDYKTEAAAATSDDRWLALTRISTQRISPLVS